MVTYIKATGLSAALTVLVSAHSADANDFNVILPENLTATRSETNQVISAVSEASLKWISAFNSGDAAAAAGLYADDAVMVAKPFGTFVGRQEIQAFWQGIIEAGFDDVEYILPSIEVINHNSAMVSSGWKMNQAFGIITKELWVINETGQARLIEDEFEVLVTQ